MKAGDPSLISLDGKTALVTGGSRGIGRAYLLTLARAGAFVGINYRTHEEEARLTLNSIREEGGTGELVPFDVSDASAVETGIADLLKHRPTIDILVNNAGISRDGLIGRMKEADWNEVLETNLSGAFHLCRTVSKTMIRNRSGRIINVASTPAKQETRGR